MFLKKYMQEKEIENKIIQRFDKLCHIFPEEINSTDFRVKNILKFLGNPSGKKILDLGLTLHCSDEHKYDLLFRDLL